MPPGPGAPRSALQAVLFDMDGTLVDTEPVWGAAELALAARYGAPWTHADGLGLVGNDLLDSGIFIRRRMGLPLSPEEIVDELVTSVLTSLRSGGVRWQPGALDLLAECNRAAMPTALVTMSYRNLADAVVDALPFGRFDAVITGEDVVHGKPAPEAYVRAAELLGVDVTASIAIEDSPTGAASAEAAGCLVITVPHAVPVPVTVNRRELRTLSGVTLAELRRLAEQR